MTWEEEIIDRLLDGYAGMDSAIRYARHAVTDHVEKSAHVDACTMYDMQNATRGQCVQIAEYEHEFKEYDCIYTAITKQPVEKPITTAEELIIKILNFKIEKGGDCELLAQGRDTEDKTC